MFLSLRRLMKLSVNHYMKVTRTEWVLCHPNQIILTVSQIMWARGVHQIFDKSEKGIQPKKLEMYEQKCIQVNVSTREEFDFILKLIFLQDLNDLAALIRSELPPVTRKILIALITIDVHARDTIQNLVKTKTRDR